MKFLICLTIAIFIKILVVAQTTDTMYLKEVEITSQKKAETNFNKTITLDSANLQYLPTASLGEILQKYAPFFIKSYGVNGLNTPAFRGTSANHTLVEWNGMELNSAMNGQFDLSSLPIFFTNEIKIKYGAASLSNTTGGFGGLLQLKNNNQFFNKPQFKIYQSYETLKNHFSAFHFGFSKNQLTHQTALLHKDYNNSFSYSNPFLDNKKETLKHANNKQYGIMQQYSWFTKKSGFVEMNAWYSSDSRQLPPLIGVSIASKEQQNTENFRTSLSWKINKKAGTISYLGDYVYEQMQYTDENKNMDFIHYNNSATNKLSFHSIKSKFGYFNVVAHYKFNDVRSDNYNAYHTRNTYGSYGEWLFDIGKNWQTIIHLGEEYINNKWMPGSGYAGLNLKPFANDILTINATAGKNYRFPTMNDLYWEIYGNPLLLPEINDSYELNTIIKKTFMSFTIQQQITFYYSKTKEMIVWQPITALLWQPLNLNTVQSNGIEFQTNSSAKIKNLTTDFNLNYAFSKVVLLHSNINDTAIENKLLPYNPQHNISSALNIKWKKWFVNGNWQFVSDYFINYQNTFLQPYNDYMPWYSVISAGAGRKWNYHTAEITTAFSAQNLMNASYMVMPGKPMPGRYFQFWIAVQIN